VEELKEELRIKDRLISKLLDDDDPPDNNEVVLNKLRLSNE